MYNEYMRQSIRYAFWFGICTLALMPFIALANEVSGSLRGGRLQNPLKSNIDTIPELVEAILDVVVLIGTPVAAIFIIYSGFLFVIARGDVERLNTAKRSLTWTLIGTAVLLGAWTLSQAISGTIQQVGGI